MRVLAIVIACVAPVLAFGLVMWFDRRIKGLQRVAIRRLEAQRAEHHRCKRCREIGHTVDMIELSQVTYGPESWAGVPIKIADYKYLHRSCISGSDFERRKKGRDRRSKTLI